MTVRRRGAAGLVLVAGAVAVAGARRLDARWSSADDPCRPDEAVLPAGRSRTVPTDDGAELAVTDAGEGPTVVLAHGWTCAREIWAPVAHRLVRSGHRVVLYDQRGHGSSTVGTDGLTIERLGADLAIVLEALDVRDAVLGGHSMGGMTIQALAADRLEVLAERAQAVVLVSTAAAGLGMGRRAPVATKLLASARVERLLRSPVGHALVRGTTGRTPRRAHLVATRDLFVACPPDVRVGCFSAMQTMDLREGVARIDLPVTVVVGSRDQLTPPRLAAQLVEAVPGARLVTLDGVGHQTPFEAPDEVAELLAGAVREAATVAV